VLGVLDVPFCGSIVNTTNHLYSYEPRKRVENSKTKKRADIFESMLGGTGKYLPVVLLTQNTGAGVLTRATR
jgi:hypothetical protein